MITPQVVIGMDLHVAAYGRQSYGRLNGSEASPASQRGANHARFELFATEAARQDRAAKWCGHYEDVGISAFSGKERPEFERLLRDCRMGRINVIIVYNISRLSRLEPTDALGIVNELLGLGVTIISTTEGVFRQGNIMDLIHLIFRLDGSYQESKNKSVAVRDAVKQARALGGYVGGKAPFGRKLRQVTRHNADGKPIAIQVLDTDADQAKIIQRVWWNIRKHKSRATAAKPTGKTVPGSLGSIVTQLNADDVPTQGSARGKKTKGGAWHIKTLAGMLRHPQLAGFATEPIYEPQKTDPAKLRVVGHRILRAEDGTPMQPWKPIIEPGDWFELQEWLDSRPKRKFENRTTALLTSMEVLYCECGRPKSANNSPRPVGGSYFCSRPSGTKRKPGEHEGGSYITRVGVDDLVARRVFALITAGEDDPETGDVLAAAAQRYGEANESPETAQERRTVVQERADAARALGQLYDDADLYRGDEVGRARWQRDVRQQQERLAGCDARMAELGETDVPVLPIASWLEQDSDATGDPIGPGTWWAKASLNDRRDLVKLFVQRVEIRKARDDEKSRGNKAEPVVEPRVTITWAKPAARQQEAAA
ncbi:recombinase family protein [Streptomyces sp. NBC_00209]|uniref:recombinase family protein n=1 Tax=Streptomyces sp. NBC_00209 TaxID=2975682 RepID=UPI00325427F8